jgi:hypothetical protein
MEKSYKNNENDNFHNTDQAKSNTENVIGKLRYNPPYILPFCRVVITGTDRQTETSGALRCLA